MEALRAAGIDAAPLRIGSCRSAAEAAHAVGCEVDRIAKSIVFACGAGCAVFLAAGGRQVDLDRAAALAGARLERADAAHVRAVTGFAIGGVSPLGHLTPSPVWLDRHLLAFPTVWAAAGTPDHVVELAPDDLRRAAGATVADFTYPKSSWQSSSPSTSRSTSSGVL